MGGAGGQDDVDVAVVRDGYAGCLGEGGFADGGLVWAVAVVAADVVAVEGVAGFFAFVGDVVVVVEACRFGGWRTGLCWCWGE